MNFRLWVVLVGSLLWFSLVSLQAETGRDAWLRYAPLTDTERATYSLLPASVVVVGHSEILQAAQQELVRGLRSMIGRTLREESELPRENAVVLGTLDDIQGVIPSLRPPSSLTVDGFWLTTAKVKGRDLLVVTEPMIEGCFTECPHFSARSRVTRASLR